MTLTKQIFTEVTIFAVYGHPRYVCSLGAPQIFQVQAKVSTARSVFPDYLSVSYDNVQILINFSKQNFDFIFAPALAKIKQ